MYQENVPEGADAERAITREDADVDDGAIHARRDAQARVLHVGSLLAEWTDGAGLVQQGPDRGAEARYRREVRNNFV